MSFRDSKNIRNFLVDLNIIDTITSFIIANALLDLSRAFLVCIVAPFISIVISFTGTKLEDVRAGPFEIGKFIEAVVGAFLTIVVIYLAVKFLQRGDSEKK